MASTITIQQVLNYASTHTELMPLAGVGGYTSEPALSFANDAMAEFFCPPFAWKFNRKTMPLMLTSQSRQDYLFAGACAFTLKGANVTGGVGIDLATNNAITESSFTVTVNTLDPHNFAVGDTIYMVGNTVAAYNSTFTVTPLNSVWTGGWVVVSTPNAKQFTFTHASSGLGTSGAPGITDFGWLEYATQVDENDTSSPQFIRYLEAARTLEPISQSGMPDKLAVTESGTAGILSVRFSMVPSSAAMGVTMVYQAAPPVLTSLAQTWAPIPDREAHVYRQMFLSKAFRYVGSPRAENEKKLAELELQRALASDDAEASEEYVTPSQPIMGYDFGY